MNNLSSGCAPYGGVRQDVKGAGEAWTNWQLPPGHCINPACDLICAGYLAGVDLPLSILGDTLTLPVTIYSSAKQPAKGAEGDDLNTVLHEIGDRKDLKFDKVHGGIE